MVKQQETSKGAARLLDRLVMFLFPWAELLQLRWKVDYLEKRIAHDKYMHEFRRAELYLSWKNLTAAHKGIRRLQKKLKKYTNEI